MKTILISKILLVCSVWFCCNQLQAQIYPAKNGVLIVFHERPEKNSKVSIDIAGYKNQTFEWPKRDNAFIQQYRNAELIFRSPTTLTDDDLMKIYSRLDSMPTLAYSFQYQVALLIALGQAAYIPDVSELKECSLEITTADKKTTTSILKWKDQRNSVSSKAVVENGKERGTNINLVLTFAKDSWIDSASVYKKVLGSNDSALITPLLMTTQFPDRVEMHLRDTANEVGEFLYTIRPQDKLGMWHIPVVNVYANNYNQVTAPRVTHFNTEVAEGSKYIRLSWQCTVPQRVRGFEIFRSTEYEGPYIKIATLPENDSVYVDHVEGTMQNFFYYVQLLDQKGAGAKSIIHFATPVMQEKPMAPKDPVAVPTPGGILINWPTFDPFYNIRGYYVYRKETEKDEWMQVSSFLSRNGDAMTFTDTSSTLKAEHQYAYALKAESTSYILSDYSISAWAYPDKQRTVSSPANFSFRFLDNGQLMLYWNDQRKDDPFISKYHIFETDAESKLMKEVTGSPIDANWTVWMQPAGNKMAYGYILQSEDAWGNVSAKSATLLPGVRMNYVAPGPVLARPTTSGYRLSWGLPDPAVVKNIQVFEKQEDGKSILVKSVDSAKTSYDLPALKTDQVKTYYINYKLANGEESEASDVVVIRG